MILTDFSTPLEDVWGQQGSYIVSLRTALPGAVRWDVLALKPDWAILQAVYAAVTGETLTPPQQVHLNHTPEFTRNAKYSHGTAS